jgi:hypothetical protein
MNHPDWFTYGTSQTHTSPVNPGADITSVGTIGFVITGRLKTVLLTRHYD